MSDLSPCPSCNSTDNNARWGHQVDGMYDGICYWSCTDCGHIWPRDFGPRIGLQRRADEHVAEVLRDRARTNHPANRG